MVEILQIMPFVFASALFSGESVVESLNVRLNSGNPTNCLSRFVNYQVNARKDTFIPNTNFWAIGIDFSCASPWNGTFGSLRAGTLISPRHIVYAAHYPLAIGSRMLFVDEEGRVCPCYLEKGKQINGTDIMIGSLNAEVTPNIKPAKLLPDDFHRYLKNCGAGLPVATFNRQEKLFLTESIAIKTNKTSRAYVGSRIPQRKELSGFRESIIVGDSGNPVFLLLGGEPVLLCCLHFGGCGSGPALHLYAGEIQRVMNELCPGYNLEFHDFEKP